MSTMTLKLPQNCVDVEKEEMRYLDGGIIVVAATAMIDAIIAAGRGFFWTNLLIDFHDRTR